MQRVGFLIDGRTRETLQGHVAIDRPLAPDFRYLVEADRPAPPAATTPDAAGSANPAEGSGDGGGTGGAGATGDGSGSGGGSGTHDGSGTGADGSAPGGDPDGSQSDDTEPVDEDDDGRVVVRALERPGAGTRFAGTALGTPGEDVRVEPARDARGHGGPEAPRSARATSRGCVRDLRPGAAADARS